MKFLFIDASPTMIAKNLLPIADKVFEINTQHEFDFISLELSSYTDSDKETESQLLLQKNDNYNFYKMKIRDIEKNIISKNYSYIVLGGYRLFDMYIISIANSYNIPTINFQHGFEIDSVYYKYQILFEQIKKVIKNLVISWYLCRKINTSFLKFLLQYGEYFFYGNSLRSSLLDNPIFRPTILFVYSEYYMKFWKNKFGLPYEIMKIIRPVDFNQIPKIRSSKRHTACCYLTQTLVEDGRLSKKLFDQLIIENYKKLANQIDHLIIKLHPRSRVSLYDELLQLPNVTLVREFPNCSVYLSHYSSTLFTAAFLSSCLIIHELPGNPTPSIFQDLTENIFTDISDVISTVANNINSDMPSFEDGEKMVDYIASSKAPDAIESISVTLISSSETN